MIYILKFDKPLGSDKHSARYYIGFCEDDACFNRRMKAHKRGQGAAITRAAVKRGIGWRVVATMEGDRSLERRLKNMKNTARIVRNLEKDWLWQPS